MRRRRITIDIAIPDGKDLTDNIKHLQTILDGEGMSAAESMNMINTIGIMKGINKGIENMDVPATLPPIVTVTDPHSLDKAILENQTPQILKSLVEMLVIDGDPEVPAEIRIPKDRWMCHNCGTITPDGCLTDDTYCGCNDIYEECWSKVECVLQAADFAMFEKEKEFQAHQKEQEGINRRGYHYNRQVEKVKDIVRQLVPEIQALRKNAVDTWVKEEMISRLDNVFFEMGIPSAAASASAGAEWDKRPRIPPAAAPISGWPCLNTISDLGDIKADFPNGGAIRKTDRMFPEHDLYKDGDADIPEQILDRNGQAALCECKRCGRVESQLVGPCMPPAETEKPKEVTYKGGSPGQKYKCAACDGELEIVEIYKNGIIKEKCKDCGHTETS